MKSQLVSCLRLLGDQVTYSQSHHTRPLSKINQLLFYMLQVETLHDFEAANSDELTLQRGDVVLVVPSDSEADQVMERLEGLLGHIGFFMGQ